MQNFIVPQHSLPYCHFFGLHFKLHGVQDLRNNYHICLDPKLGHGFAIRSITGACISCTIMLDNPWSPDVYHNQKPRYQSVVDFKYWPVLGNLSNCNIIHFTNKIHQVRILMVFIRFSLMTSVTIWNN